MKNQFIILFTFISLHSWAQILKNNNAFLYITPGAIIKGVIIDNTTGTVTNSGTITCTSDLTNNATINGNGTYNVAGNFINNSTFNAGTSTVVFNGAAAQTTGGISVTDFYNVTVNNTMGGVSLGTDERLIGTLTLTSGVFTTTGKIFTLISNVNGTARIAEITGGNIAGNITMQRYVAGGDGWRMLTGTVNSDIEDWNGEFAMSGFPGTEAPSFSFKSVQTYNEAISGYKENGYETPANTTDALVAGRGYFAWIGDALGAPIVKTLDLIGPPNTFTKSLPVTYTDDPGQPATEDGWNLVGNPYPSTINWDAAGWTKASLNSTIYTWSDAIQNYAAYTTGGPDPGPNGGRPTIASMQGFWVQTNNSVPTPELTAVESVKSATDQPFFKQTQNNYILLKLKMTAPNGSTDETFIRFMQDATTDFEGDKDGYKLFSGSALPPQISSIINDSLDLCLNSLPELNQNVVIPIRTKAKVSGNFLVTASGANDIPYNFCVLFEDKLTGNFTDFKTDSSYIFYLTDTTSAPRFALHFLQNDSINCMDSTIIYNKEVSLSRNQIFVINKNNELDIYFDLSESTNATVALYNLLWQHVIEEKNHTVRKNTVHLDLRNTAQALYLLSVTTPNQKFTQKVFLR